MPSVETVHLADFTPPGRTQPWPSARIAVNQVSVVIPCYNAARYVAATLRSVLSQTGVEMQVIVVDDGSTDGSAELVRSQFPDVALVQQPNQGVAAARNRGVQHAVHDWVAFVDADDIWLPGKLQAQLHLLSAHPQARMAYTSWQVWTSDDPEPAREWLSEVQAGGDKMPTWIGPSGWIYPELLLICEVWTSTVLARRSLLEELGGFDPTLRIGEDWDLWLRASRVTQILQVPKPLALYRMHPDSITKAPPDVNFKHLVLSRAVGRWGYVGPDGRSVSKVAFRRSQARTWSDLAVARMKAGDLARARCDAAMAVRTAPGYRRGWTVLAKTLVQSIMRDRVSLG